MVGGRVAGEGTGQEGRGAGRQIRREARGTGADDEYLAPSLAHARSLASPLPPPFSPTAPSFPLCLPLCLPVFLSSLTHARARARYSFPPVCALDVRMHNTQHRRTGLTGEEGGRREESTSSKAAAYVPGHAFACGVCRLGPICRVR